MELVRLCAENPYFECDFGFFKQQGGTHMGGALSRLFADLIIENKIEKKIQEDTKWSEIWDWVRLIDDTLSCWDSEEIFREFFAFLNTLHSGIKWTCEVEEEGKLPIFDIMIIRTLSGYDTTVYRKSTASERYIHYTSSQSIKEKLGAIRTLKHRALRYCSNNDLLKQELAKLEDIFLKNGYPRKIIKRVLYEEKRQGCQPKEFGMDNAFYIPYHPRGRRLCRILEEKFGLATIYKKTQTLGNLLKKKVRIPEKIYTRNAVYKIPCGQCEIAYIGQNQEISESEDGRTQKEMQGKEQRQKIESRETRKRPCNAPCNGWTQFRISGC
jgi:hypothetical protein